MSTPTRPGRPCPKAERKTYQGLRKEGSTCYLNSILQVLFMTREFREAVEKELSQTSHIDTELKDLFIGLKTSSPTTHYFIQKLGIENKWEQRDAAEYFERILNLASPQASQIFLGGLTHSTTCSQCSQSTDVDGSFWTLNLAINNDSTGDYNVEDGLKAFFSKSTFTGDNQLYCDHCEAKADATIECKLDKHPGVLVLLLKRFEFDYNLMGYVKNNRPVDVPLTIEIPQHYDLYATVNHYGDLRWGHYTATIKPPDDGNCSWYTFNDSWVTLENNFNPKQSRSAYLLLYRRRLVYSLREVHHGLSVEQHPEFGTTTIEDDDNDHVSDNADESDNADNYLVVKQEAGEVCAGSSGFDDDDDVVDDDPQTDKFTESEDRDESSRPMIKSPWNNPCPSSSSSSGPTGEGEVWTTGRGDVMHDGDDVMGCDDVMGGDVMGGDARVRSGGDTHPPESARSVSWKISTL